MNSRKRKEIRQMITLAVTAAVIVALIIVYFVVSNAVSGDGEDTTPSQPDIGTSGTFTIIDEDYTEITALSYTYEGSRVSMHIDENGKWVLDDDEKFPVNQEIVVNMSQAISDYGGYRQIIYDPANVSAYGTDDPLYEISATYYNGDDTTETHTRRFLIGNQNTLTGYYYFYEDGDSCIYAVEDKIFPYFSYSKTSLFSSAAVPTPDPEDIISMTVEFDGGEYRYSADDETTDIAPAKVVMENLPKQAQLRYADAADYGVSDADMAKYGLSEPSMRITLDYKEYTTVSASEGNTSAQMTKEKEFVMLFGDRFTEGEGDDAEEFVYMTDEGSGTVYKVYANRFDKLLAAVSDNGTGTDGE